MAASMTGKCSLVADIGSDHAYLPVSLILSGNASRAIVTDLRQGPLENSRRTAQKYGLVEKMSFSRGSGFGALDGYERPDVITVCGMGGELIKSFIGERPDIARGSGDAGKIPEAAGLISHGSGHIHRRDTLLPLHESVVYRGKGRRSRRL